MLKNQHLGLFDDEEVAARAFDKQARELRGAKAHGGRAGPSATRWRINFPTKKEIAKFGGVLGGEANVAARPKKSRTQSSLPATNTIAKGLPRTSYRNSAASKGGAGKQKPAGADAFDVFSSASADGVMAGTKILAKAAALAEAASAGGRAASVGGVMSAG
jgi:hypothetical protein